MLLVDIKSKKVLSMEVGKEFVDFVFSLLTLPVGAVEKLISASAMHGIIGQLCTRRLMKLTIARTTDEPYADVWRGIAPGEHGEGLQVLHYEVGQKYESHFHYFLDGQRMETILMYLSDVEEGGETIFPDANGTVLLSKGTSGHQPSGCTLASTKLRPSEHISKVKYKAKCEAMKRINKE
ncbi:putative prolyl 4-hydroxylase 3 [Hordeum vulgare]|nr:putative prolyl 4-hydroxylase 3 [Hordeum vulgare]